MKTLCDSSCTLVDLMAGTCHISPCTVVKYSFKQSVKSTPILIDPDTTDFWFNGLRRNLDNPKEDWTIVAKFICLVASSPWAFSTRPQHTSWYKQTCQPCSVQFRYLLSPTLTVDIQLLECSRNHYYRLCHAFKCYYCYSLPSFIWMNIIWEWLLYLLFNQILHYIKGM